MAKAGADTSGGENQGGFSSDMSPIYGFSHMHDSGTGGSASLGNFLSLRKPDALTMTLMRAITLSGSVLSLDSKGA